MTYASDLLRDINEDRVLAAAVLFPHRHKQATPPFHISIMDLWRSANELVVIEAFRQGAKTTLSEEFTLIEALFGNFNYMLIFGETYTKACQRITGMKHELNTNRHIKMLFGDQKLTKSTENKLILPNGVCIEAHGWEEEIRGYLYLNHRPDRVMLDDIETRERVRDTETVDKNWKRIYMELIPAMDKDNCKIRMTGTPLAEDCMITRAIKSEHWVSGVFPICDGDPSDPATQSLWPERYPMDWIRNQQAMYTESSTLNEFNQEYLLIPAGAQSKTFDESMLKFVEFAPETYSPKAVIMDPARTTDIKKSDQTGCVVVSRIGSKIYVHHSSAEFWQPDEVIDAAFKLSDQYDNAEVGIEKNSLDNWLLQPMRAKMLQSGVNLKLKLINAPQDRDKAQFITGLRSFFMAGEIIFVGGRQRHQKLINQITNFPTGKKDVLNALAYVQRIFSGIPVYSDFSDANISRSSRVSRQATLFFVANASSADTTAVLVAYDEGRITIIKDWNSPLAPSDAMPNIIRSAQMLYPEHKLHAWVTGDVGDQIGRHPLIDAIKRTGLKPNVGCHTSLSRGNLSSPLRNVMRNRRELTFDSEARDCLQAMASGYCWPVKPNGERMGEPERNSARLLIESLEVLVYALNKKLGGDQSYRPNSTNPQGRPYMSALK